MSFINEGMNTQLQSDYVAAWIIYVSDGQSAYDNLHSCVFVCHSNEGILWDGLQVEVVTDISKKQTKRK